MIGLKRGTVRLVRHHKQWAVVFAHEKKRLLSRVGHLVVSVEHIGSTAIPGLDAKPIIDMLAGVTRLKTDLLFRAFLLNHPKRTKMYATLKRNLARQYPNNREKYTAGKGVFIRKTIALAKTTLGCSRT